MLISETGYFLLLLSLSCALAQCVVPSIGMRINNKGLQLLAARFAYGQAICLWSAFGCLMYSFYTNDFTVAYVASHSNSLMPWYYKLSATWAGHEGSLLLWVAILSGWCALVAYRGARFPLGLHVRTLVVLASVQCCMLMLLVFSSSPFDTLLPHVVVDGADLNPLLQDPGLIFHPPILYMGYVGLAVPFACAVSALWLGQLDRLWVAWMRVWTLCAWVFLTLGIALGSWWAYYELGWGGWWFWDPVENASLMPWLASTALLHALSVTQKRGVFKAWTVLLAIMAFGLSLLGTFLVRSGVLTSVHAFAADPQRGLFLLTVLSLIVGAALLLFAVRGWRLIPESRYGLRSRESLLAMNNMLMLTAIVVVFLGTLYPIIADAFGLSNVSVGAPYFNALVVPLTWLVLLAMGLSPVIRWKQDTQPLVGPILAMAFISIVLGCIICAVTMQSLPLSVALTAVLTVWVVCFILYDLLKQLRRVSNRITQVPIRIWSMHLAHIGVLTTCLGVALTDHLSVEKDVVMQFDQHIDVAGYKVTFEALSSERVDNYDTQVGQFEVTQAGQHVVTLYPEKRRYVVRDHIMTEAAIHTGGVHDIYIALGEPLDKSDVLKGWTVRVYIKPYVRLLWLGALLMAMAGLLAALTKRRQHP